VTYAICIKCGEAKVGALTMCPDCGFDPTLPEDGAKSIMLSDQILPKSDLEAAAARIKSGEGVTFDPESVAKIAALVPQATASTKGSIRMLLLFVAILVVVVVLYSFVL
jgi:hypothetical protein